MANENLNNWNRRFRKVGSAAISFGGDVLRSVAPGITSTAESSIDVLRDSRQYVLKSKTQLQQYHRALKTTKMGKESLQILNSAFNDIKNGAFSLGKNSDDLYDMADSFDDSFSNFDLDTSDPTSVAMMESTKNMAIIGRSMAEGNAATIEGMRDMTETLSNVTLKAAESSVGQLSNIALNGIGQTNYYLSGINNRLDVINENIVSLLDFQRNVTYQTNQASMEYYSESSQMMQQMGQAIAEMQDYIKSQKEMEKQKKTTNNSFDVSDGFNIKEYAKFVKKNFDNSTFGTLLSMGSMGLSMMDMMGESPVSMIGSMFGSNLIPKNIKKSIERFDKTFTSSIDTILYNLGDMANDTDFLKSTIGTMFGKKRQKFGKTNLADFKKDTMGWNGIAQKTLVTVIPSYLANIEAALTKKDSRHYDMDSGKFMTRSDLEKDFKEKFISSQEFAMSSFSDKLGEVFKNSSLSQADKDSIRDLIDNVTYQQLMGTGGSRKDATRTIFESMNNKVSNNELRDVLMEWQSNMTSMISEMNNMMKVSGTKYETLFNENGASTNHLYGKGKVSRRHMYTYTDDGRQVDVSGMDADSDLFMQYQREQEDANRFKEWKKRIVGKVRSKLGMPQNPSNQRHVISDGIDYGANTMFDLVNGLGFNASSNSNHNSSSHTNGGSNSSSGLNSHIVSNTNTNSSAQSTQQLLPATSSSVSNYGSQLSRNVQTEVERSVKNSSLDTVLQLPAANLESESARINTIIEEDKATDNQSTLSKLVLSLQTNFLKPMVNGLFGKEGFFKKILDNDHVKKIKDTLFNEKDGIFKEVTLYMKDQVAAIKHVFTGKGYTDSEGNFHDEDTNSVFDHFAKGYDFVFKNAMTHIFGEDFKENSTYQKYLSFFDFKGKRDKKREDRIAKQKEQEAQEELEKLQSNLTINNLDDRTGYGYLDDNGNYVSSEKHVSQINKSIARHQKKLNKMKSVTSQTVETEKILSDAAVESAEKIKSSTENMTEALFGDMGSDDKGKSDKAVKSVNKSFTDSIKKNLPKGLAIAGAGALGGAILGIGGTGLIGSLFLPTGIIGGAIVASGIAIASKSEGIKKFLFGEKDDDGKHLGGLISNRTQEFVKKNMPLIVGGGALGLLKNIVLGSGGGVLGTLVGGPIAGAALSVGLGLLKQNDAVQNILFGKKNEDGKKTSGTIAKSMNKIMEKSGNFIKGGAKGLGVGLLTGTVVSQMGLLGSALTIGGPIGAGIAGLGIGIASQTSKFNELLFGTKEFDENGNLKGRAGDGLLTRVKNLLVVNVFEPIKDSLQQNVIDFAYWAKEKIEFPFRLAFGPILDSISTIHKNVTETVHDVFNNVGESVTKMMKKGIDKVFKPITNMMGKVASGIGFLTKNAIKMAALPITAPLKMLEIMSAPKRFKARWDQDKMLISNFGTLLQGAKDVTDTAYANGEYGTGIKGKFNYIKNGFKNVREVWDGAHFASNDELKKEGKNHLGWMDVPYEKKDLKKQKEVLNNDRKTWRSINKERRAMVNANGGAIVNYTDDELARQQKKFAKLGINKEFISNNEDFNMFLNNKADWEDKFLKPKQGEQSTEAVVNRIGKHGLPTSSDTKAYREKVLAKFDNVTREITKITAQQYLGSKSEFSLKEIKSMNKRFSEMGITWDDLGFDPTELVNKADISDDDWMRLLYQTETRGGFTNGSFSIKDFFKWQKENKEEYQKYSDEVDAETAESASLNVLNDISESVRASAVANMNQAAMNGAAESDIEASTGLNLGSREFKINKIWKKKLAADAAKQREEEENKKVKSGTKEFADEEAGKAIVDPENATEEQKSSLFDKVGGFFSDVFGSFGSFLGSHKGQTLLTAGVVGTALLGEKAVDLAKSAWDLIGPPIMSNLKKAGNWLVENGPGLLDQLEEFVNKNISTVTDFLADGLIRFGKIAGNVFINIGKKAANWVCEQLPFNWVPFPEASSKSQTEVFDDVAKAQSTADAEGKHVYINPITGQAEIVAENEDIIDQETGEKQKITSGAHLRAHTLATFGRELATSPMTRSFAKNGTQLLAKGVGWVSGLIPGFKISKGILGAGTSLIGTTAKGISSVGTFAKNQITKKSGEAIIEEGVQEGAEAAAKSAAKQTAKNVGKNIAEELSENGVKAGKDVAEDVARGSKDEAAKGITKFIKIAKEKILNFAKSVSDVIPEGKFKTLMKKFCDWVGTLVKKLPTGKLSSLTDWITEKIAKVTGKTGAAAGTAGLSMLVFGVIDGISGALDAPYLFGVTNDDVDARMRVISSLMYAILGLPVVAYFDILLELVGLITGKNPKQTFARWAYKNVFASGDEAKKLDEAATRLQLETDKYNKANNTNLTTDAYLEKRNAGSGLFGTIGKGWTYLTNRDKYNQKYNFTKYSVSDDEVQRELAKSNTSATYEYTDSSDEILVGLGPGRQKSQFKRYKAIGYGYNTMLQGDSRWGDYPIGYFPDGSVSTMSTGGCGPTALAMIANEVGYGASPVTVAQYAKNNGYIKDGGATSGLFTEGASRMGLRSTALSKSSLRTSLQKGESVIVSGKSTSANSPYTEAGHIVKASGLDSNGNAIVDDPMRGRTSVSVNDLTSGMTNGWSYSVGYGPANNTFDASVFKTTPMNKNKVDTTTFDKPLSTTKKSSLITTTPKANATPEQKKLLASWNKRVQDAQKKVETNGVKDNSKLISLVKKFDNQCSSYLQYKKTATAMTGKPNENPVIAGANVEQIRDTLDQLYDEIKKLDPSFELSEEQDKAFNDIYIRSVDSPRDFTESPTSLTAKQSKKINEMLKELKQSGYKFGNVDANKLFLKGFVINTSSGGLFIVYNGKQYKVPMEYEIKRMKKSSKFNYDGVYEIALEALLNILKENYISKVSTSGAALNRALSTNSQIVAKIKDGWKTNADGVVNFNTPEFYVGLIVLDLDEMIKITPELIDNQEIPFFAQVYQYYTASTKYKDKPGHKFTIEELTSIAQAAGLDDFFGSFGTIGGYDFKNGFPFFSTADTRWGEIPWRDSKLRITGDDISSLAMITSAFGENLFTPKYIYDNWLKNYPGWYNNRKGLNTANVFKDGGFNALQSTQVDGQRLKVSALRNVESIKSALKSRKPVYMTGLKYKGSIFGGSTPLGSVDPSKSDAYGTVVGIAANDTHLAVNNPKTTIDESGIFDIDALTSTVQNGTKKVNLIKNAYQVTNPDGTGIDGHVDLSTKSGGTSDYTEIDPKSGLMGMLSAIISNFAAVGSHMIDSLGGSYRSIFDENPIENDITDSLGLDESAFAQIEDFDNVTFDDFTSDDIANVNSIDSNFVVSDTGKVTYKGRTITGTSSIEKALTESLVNNRKNRGVDTTLTKKDKTLLKKLSKTLNTRNKRKKLSSSNKKTTTVTAGAAKLMAPNMSALGYGIGGGSRDFALGYGTENKISKIPDIFEEMNAITYALEAQHLGGDYNAAKEEYYANKQQEAQGTDATTTDGTAQVSGVAGTAGVTAALNPSAFQASSLTGDKKEFVEKVAPGAVKGNEQYGVKASLTLAQGALESGWGKDAIGNNLFGIKAGSGWTGKTQTVSTTEYDANNHAYTTTATFRDYDSIDDSILDHAKLLTGTRYKGVLAANNYKEACYAVKAAGYATDPNYPSKLINLIETNGFAAYDNMTSASFGTTAGGASSTWLQIVQATKQAIAGTGVGYSTSNYITINVLGQNIKVRTDCSGFVSACCILYGEPMSVLSSSGFCSKPSMSKFTKQAWTGWDSLLPGDIIAVDGHVEIFAGKDSSGNNMVYNCGSTASIQNPGPTHSSRSAYTCVWRPIETANVGSVASNATATTSTTNTNTTSTTSTANAGVTGQLGEVLSSISNIANESINNLTGYGRGSNNPVAFLKNSLGGEVLSGYGSRKSGLGSEYHRGVDIGAALGSPIYSPISGTVVASGNDVSGYGNYSVIRDKRGNNHLFAHMNKPVGYGVGTKINKNDLIGAVGASGRATGSHLHYEIRKNGNKYSALNPMNYRYDKELGKNLNVSSLNMRNATEIGYGTGNRDIPMNDPKFNVDVNTKNVEEKLDSLISVMTDWANRDGKSSNGATNFSQVTNNNTTVYGEGKKKTTSSTKSSNPGVDLRSKSLEAIHKALASK